MSEAARLSKLLFTAREAVEMYADVIKALHGNEAVSLRRLVEEIDTYRAERGWSPNGFGGES